MKHLKLLCMLLTAILAAVFCIDASAQFKEEAFTQQYNDDTAADSDTTDVLFSFKEYFGLSPKEFVGKYSVPGQEEALNKLLEI